MIMRGSLGSGSLQLAWRRVPRQPQVALPPTDVMPGAVLEADLAEHTDWPEADRLVKADARVVGERDAGEHHLDALALQPGQQLAVQSAAEPAAVVLGLEVDGGLGAPAIGGALAVGGRVRVAHD